MALKRNNTKEDYIKKSFVDNVKVNINMPVMEREELIEIINAHRNKKRI